MPGLKVALLELTSACNRQCLTCGSNSRWKQKPGELSVKEWCRVLDELTTLGTEKVVFSGGEPTIQKGIEHIINHVSTLPMKYAVISNGFHLPFSVLEVMSRHKPYVFGVSIDGTPATHDWLRGGKGSFANLMASIHLLSASGIPVSVNTTVHRKNYAELTWIASFIEEQGILAWQIQLAMPFGRMEGRKKWILSQREFAEVCVFIAKTRESMPEVNIIAADDFSYAPAGIIRRGEWLGCSAGLSSIGIDALGNIKGCLSMKGCQSEGNVRRHRLSDIWEDSGLFSYNRQFELADLSKECQGCSRALQCKGGCNSQSYSMTGKFHQSPFCFYRTVMGKTVSERR